MKKSYFITNAITGWRILMAPVIVALAWYREINLFKWLLAISFLTDAIDGFIARRFNVTSTRGAMLDSMGDDLTIAAAIAGMIIFKMDFVKEEASTFLILSILFLLHTTIALSKYGKLTSFHTWTAKIAAIAQASFLLGLFFLPAPPYTLFQIAAVLTLLDLMEEIVMMHILDKWEPDIRGLYSIWRRTRKAGRLPDQP